MAAANLLPSDVEPSSATAAIASIDCSQTESKGGLPAVTSANAPWREHASLAVIKSARRLFARTPIEKLSLTTAIKAKVFSFSGANGEVTTHLRGIQLTFPAKDIILAPALMGGFYEKIELDVFERLAATSKTIVDVGANIGLYCCIAADRAPDAAKIVAFEPVPENLGYLRRNLEENELAARVVVEEQAVGQASGRIEIYLLEGSTARHSASAKNVQNSTTSITVPAVSLDGYLQQKLGNRPIDLLKVDVEGYESAVLRGARRILHEDKPTLFIEFVPDNLVNCGFRPDEFLDIIFGIYDNVLVVDEPRSTFKPCSKHDLLRYSTRRYMNANLIAISESNQPAHCQVIESIRASLNEK
jgi:FkbM family methyltransferase